MATAAVKAGPAGMALKRAYALVNVARTYRRILELVGEDVQSSYYAHLHDEEAGALLMFASGAREWLRILDARGLAEAESIIVHSVEEIPAAREAGHCADCDGIGIVRIGMASVVCPCRRPLIAISAREAVMLDAGE